MDDGNTCLLRRMISENGRSRAWINGTTVTLQQLAGLGERLVEIHGQNEHILLVQSAEQFRLLDGSGDYEEALAQVSELPPGVVRFGDAKTSLAERDTARCGDMDLMRYQIRELEGSMISAAEFSTIEAEHRVLAHGGEILETLEYAFDWP